MNSGASVNTERVRVAARKDEQERSMERKEESIEREIRYIRRNVRLRVFENRVLRIFVPRRVEVTGE